MATSWASPAEERVPSKPAFTGSEIQIILSHGPWGAPAPRDPTNRVSGKPEAVELGMHLFFDQRLSGRGTVACATCHVPERNWNDNLRRSTGMAEMDRNTPTLMNLHGARWFGWDGAADSLWFQSLRPILDQRELAATPRHVASLMRNDGQLICRYRSAFGKPIQPARTLQRRSNGDERRAHPPGVLRESAPGRVQGEVTAQPDADLALRA